MPIKNNKTPDHTRESYSFFSLTNFLRVMVSTASLQILAMTPDFAHSSPVSLDHPKGISNLSLPENIYNREYMMQILCEKPSQVQGKMKLQVVSLIESGHGYLGSLELFGKTQKVWLGHIGEGNSAVNIGVGWR